MLRCDFCETTETPLWRAGPRGPKTLCNACGVKWKKGKLDGFGPGACNVPRTHTGKRHPRAVYGRPRRAGAVADALELPSPERSLSKFRGSVRPGWYVPSELEYSGRIQHPRRSSSPPETRCAYVDVDREDSAPVVREQFAPSVFAPSIPCRGESAPLNIVRKDAGRGPGTQHTTLPADHLIRESLFVRVDSERALASDPIGYPAAISSWDDVSIESLSEDGDGADNYHDLELNLPEQMPLPDAAHTSTHVLGGEHDWRHAQGAASGETALPLPLPLAPAKGSLTKTMERELVDAATKGVRLLLDAARYVEYASSPLSSQWSPLRSASSSAPPYHQAGTSSPNRLTPSYLTPMVLEKDW